MNTKFKFTIYTATSQFDDFERKLDLNQVSTWKRQVMDGLGDFFGQRAQTMSRESPDDLGLMRCI
ncbi:MAG: hypothetical protein JKY92_05545 [Magnetovibrio sp.]|nr:hypothetical protein [Magnetovibrio sp.]